jgi:hypothetical protein
VKWLSATDNWNTGIFQASHLHYQLAKDCQSMHWELIKIIKRKMTHARIETAQCGRVILQFIL